MPLDEVIQKVRLYNPNADLDLLHRAYEFASDAHCKQKRHSGDDYISHPVAVARILAELEMDQETIAAALLHDVVEDVGMELCAIRCEFGDEVALLVDGVTKLHRLAFRTKEEQQAENMRKMLLAMAKDIRVVLIKLADRLHNLRTLNYHTENKQKEIARETLEIFAPLAHRLGIYHLKWELEDEAFRYLEPEKYHDLARQLQQTREVRERYIYAAMRILDEKLGAMGIEADIQGRAKHLYSIYGKMIKQQKDLSEIYDAMGVRIIVNSVKDCYATLGAVHNEWKPIPGRFKDFIAMPKSNMYQSLHTTVIGPEGKLLEIQIRTWEMHRTGEYGIAAHWRYKTGSLRGDKQFDEKLAWLRQMLDWQKELREPREFMETLKIDLFEDVVFVFTPRGDVMELPASSVPLDFAYRIHTDIGHRCIGAKVNGKLVPLDYRLRNGDIIEIVKSKHPSPSRDWLSVVKTSQAKTKIRNWFKKEQRDENIARGRETLEREARKLGVDFELLRGEKMQELGRRYSYQSIDDLFAAVGLGVIAAHGLVARLRDQVKVPTLPEIVPDRKNWSKSTKGIMVKDVGGVLVRLAHCCNPVPGDLIVGYITRGRGVSVHRGDCRNITAWIVREKERLVEVMWDQNFDDSFQIRLEISGMDRHGLLLDVMNCLTEMKISANWVKARGNKQKGAIVELTVEIRNLEQLKYLSQRINRVKDVFEVRRLL
jgi:GTP pyrophosphokinase